MYVKRFLWGVDGVREAGKEVLEELLGGVCDRVGSFIVAEWDEGGKVESGDRFEGVGCGIVVSKISERSNVENVRFASSAGNWVSEKLAGGDSHFWLLLWKWSSPCGVRFFCFEGVAGEPSS